MPRRTSIVLWAAVAVAVVLLGGGVATVRRLVGGGGGGDLVALSLTVVGLAGALLVAGRIVVVSARAERRARRG